MSQKKGMETLQKTQESPAGCGWGQTEGQRSANYSISMGECGGRESKGAWPGGEHKGEARDPSTGGVLWEAETKTESECMTFTALTPTDGGVGRPSRQTAKQAGPGVRRDRRKSFGQQCSSGRALASCWEWHRWHKPLPHAVTGWRAEAERQGARSWRLAPDGSSRRVLSRREITAATAASWLPCLFSNQALPWMARSHLKGRCNPPSSPALPVPLLGALPCWTKSHPPFESQLRVPSCEPSHLPQRGMFPPAGWALRGRTVTPAPSPSFQRSSWHPEDVWLVSGGRGMEGARGAV